MRCGSVLWVSKVSRGHLGRVSMRFCEGLTIFWWILSEKPGFQEYLKWHYLRSKIGENLKNPKKLPKSCLWVPRTPKRCLGHIGGVSGPLGLISDNFFEKSIFSDFEIFSGFQIFKKSQKKKIRTKIFFFLKNVQEKCSRQTFKKKCPPICPKHLSGVLGFHRQLFGNFFGFLRFSPILLLK